MNWTVEEHEIHEISYKSYHDWRILYNLYVFVD